MALIRDRVRGSATARACVVSAEIMALAAAAHTSAGGELPSATWLGATSAVVLLASAYGLRGIIRIRTAALAIGACQIGLHFAFRAGASMGAGTMHGSSAHAMSMDSAMQAGHAMQGHHLSAGMFAAHLISAVVAAALLTVQDHALARARRWFRSLRVPASLRIRTAPYLPLPATPLGTPTPLLLLLTAPGRGPPAALIVAS